MRHVMDNIHGEGKNAIALKETQDAAFAGEALAAIKPEMRQTQA
jgi:hypothetical protein